MSSEEPPSKKPKTTVQSFAAVFGGSSNYKDPMKANVSSNTARRQKDDGRGPQPMLVSKRQKDNPILKHLINVGYKFSNIIPDYEMGSSRHTCALYLSLRYHKLHPLYIYERLKLIQKRYQLRVLLCHVDVKDPVSAIEVITQIALVNEWTLICCFYPEEVARYLESFHIFQKKSAAIIKEKIEEKQEAKLSDVLGQIKGVNSTDMVTMGSTFVTLAGIMQARKPDLEGCPGLGHVKIQRIYDAFRKPFKRTPTKPPTQSRLESSPPEGSSSGSPNGSSEPSSSSSNLPSSSSDHPSNSSTSTSSTRPSSSSSNCSGSSCENQSSLDGGLGTSGKSSKDEVQ